MKMNLIHGLIFPCSEATLLIEKRESGNISVKEKIRLSLHLKVCKWCRAYNQKVRLLTKLMGNSIEETFAEEFNEAEIQRFKERLKEVLKK